MPNGLCATKTDLRGFVAGYWTRKDNTGLSMVVFDSEDAANSAKEQLPSMIPDAVTLEMPRFVRLL